MARPATRGHGAVVFLLLTIADCDLAIAEVHVLDTEADPFHQARTGPGEQPRHPPVGATHAGEQALGLLAREDHGDAHRPLGPLDALDLRQLDARDIPVQEEGRAERLVLRRGSDSLVGGEVREEVADLVRAHLRGVALASEEAEALDPSDVSAPGADAIMLEPQAPPDLLAERRFIGQ